MLRNNSLAPSFTAIYCYLAVLLLQFLVVKRLTNVRM